MKYGMGGSAGLATGQTFSKLRRENQYRPIRTCDFLLNTPNLPSRAGGVLMDVSFFSDDLRLLKHIRAWKIWRGATRRPMHKRPRTNLKNTFRICFCAENNGQWFNSIEERCSKIWYVCSKRFRYSFVDSEAFSGNNVSHNFPTSVRRVPGKVFSKQSGAGVVFSWHLFHSS